MSERGKTVRDALGTALRGERLSARELSARVGIGEKDVAAHLEHLSRSLPHGGERLVIHPATCQNCGFVFKKRERLAAPSRCPVCKSERVAPPTFSVVED